MRIARWRGAALVLMAAGSVAWAGLPEAIEPAPAPPEAGFEQRPDAPLPLALPFVDSQARPVRLGDAFDDRPVLLVLGYYRCPQLCGLLMHGLLEALQQGGLPRTGYRIVRVSIDPQDTPPTAAARRAADLAYAAALQGAAAAAPLDLRLLTGPAASVAALTQAVGFRFERTGTSTDDAEAAAARYAHATGVIVATPGGRISRTLMGVRFDAQALRLALVDASEGRIGGLTDRIALLCAHLDPRRGRHTGAVMAGVRATGLALLLALVALWTVQHRRRAGR